MDSNYEDSCYEDSLVEFAASQTGESNEPTEKNENRKDKATLFRIFGDMGIEVRYNKLSQAIEYREGGGKWELFNDRRTAHLRDTIAVKETYVTTRGESPLHYGRDAFHDALNAMAFEREENPFQTDFLDHLPEWAGVERIDFLLDDLFEADQSDLTAWCSRYPLIGAIQRTTSPGCKLDEFPILIGDQGIGKSSFLRELLPESYRDDWFSDSVNIRQDEKFLLESTKGRVICEISEMAGYTRADTEFIKSYTSRQNDGTVRQAYRRDPEKLLRTFVFIGTSNDEQCLPNDYSGNRRFVPVLLKEDHNIEEYMANNREQLWAEALYKYANEGLRANLPRELINEAKEAQEAARSKDETFEDALDDAIAAVESGSGLYGIEGFKIADLKEQPVFEDYAKKSSREIGKLLRNRGYKNKGFWNKTKGRTQKLWYKS